jgi:hypothetical protein
MGRRTVVARSSLRAITFVSARCASLRLTSIAPTPLDVHIPNRRAVVAAIASVAIVDNNRRQPNIYYLLSFIYSLFTIKVLPLPA